MQKEREEEMKKNRVTVVLVVIIFVLITVIATSPDHKGINTPPVTPVFVPPTAPPQGGGGTIGGDPTRCVTPNTQRINVRAGAGTGYGVVDGLDLGAEVELLNQSGEWYQVTGGWISSTVSHVVDCRNQPQGQPVTQSCLTTMEINGLTIVLNELPFQPAMVERVYRYMESVVPRLYANPTLPPMVMFTFNYEWAKGFWKDDGFGGIFGIANWDNCQIHDRDSRPNVNLMMIITDMEREADVFGTMVHEMCHGLGGVHGLALLPFGLTDSGFEQTTGAGDCSWWNNLLDRKNNVADSAWLNQCQRDDGLCQGLRQAIIG